MIITSNLCMIRGHFSSLGLQVYGPSLLKRRQNIVAGLLVPDINFEYKWTRK